MQRPQCRQNHNNYLDYQTKVCNDTTTALKGETNILWKDCPLEAKLHVTNVLKFKYPYFYRFQNDWAGQELMRHVLENKRNHKANKTIAKRAAAAQQKAKGKGKEPATGNKAPSTTADAETLDTETGGAGPSNSEHTVGSEPSRIQAKPNKDKGKDKDDIDSDKEIERHKEPSRPQARPKPIRRIETDELARAPVTDKPASPVASTVCRTSSPGPLDTTGASNQINKSSKKCEPPGVEELTDSEDKVPVKPTKKIKTLQASHKETENTPVEVPVPPASKAKSGKNKKQKVPAAKPDNPESEEDKVAPPTKKAKAAKKPKATATQEEESKVDEDTLGTVAPLPAANTTKNKKQKAAEDKGGEAVPVTAGTKKRKAPEPKVDSLDLSEVEDVGKGKSKFQPESEPEEVEVEEGEEDKEPVARNPNGKNSKKATGGKKKEQNKAAQQDPWDAEYAAQVAEAAQKLTPAQKRAATKAAKEAQAGADKAAKEAQAAANKATQVAAQLNDPSTPDAPPKK